MAITLEQLNIKIIGNATDATTSVDRLVGALRRLRSEARDIAGYSNSVNAAIRTLGKAASGAAGSGSLGKQYKQLREETVAATGAIEGFSQATSSTVTETKVAASAQKQYNTDLKQTKVAAGQVAKAVKETGDAAKKSASGFESLMKSIGRIAFYRLIRTAIREFTKAVKEGLEAYIEYDRAVKDSSLGVANAVDEMKEKWLQVKGELGALAGQLLTVIKPIVIGISDIILNIINFIQKIIALLKGESTYQRAIRKDAEATTASAKELKRVLFGFDELNVLPSQSGSGGGVSTSGIGYREEPVEFFVKAKEMIKKLWNEHLKPFFDKVGEKIKNIWDDHIKPFFDNIGEKVKGIWNDHVKPFFDKIGEKVSGIWNDQIKPFFENIGLKVKGIWNDHVKPFFDNIGTKVGGIWNDHIKPFFSNIGIKISDIWSKVKEFFNNFGTNIKGAWDSVKGFFDNIKGKIDGVIESIKGLFEKIKQKFNTMLKDLVLAIPDPIADFFKIDKKKIALSLGFVVSERDGKWMTVLGDGKANIKAMLELVMTDADKKKLELLTSGELQPGMLASEKFSFLTFTPGDPGGNPSNTGGNGGKTTYVPTAPSSGTKATTPAAPSSKTSSGDWAYGAGKQKIKLFASGGVPDVGSLFYAGENGAEVVANMGNHQSGVLNVMQMQAAMEGANEGVVGAVMAMSNAVVNAIRNKDTNVYMDGEVISRKVTRSQNNVARRFGEATV